MSIDKDRRILIVEIQMFFHCMGVIVKYCFHDEVFCETDDRVRNKVLKYVFVTTQSTKPVQMSCYL